MHNKGKFDYVTKAFSARFAEKYQNSPSNWQLVATEDRVQALEAEYAWVGDFPTLRDWDHKRHVKDVTAYSYKIKAKRKESTLRIGLDDLKFRQLDSYGLRVDRLAATAKRAVNRDVWQMLSNGITNTGYDGKAYFATDHVVNGANVSNFADGVGDPWYLLYTRDASLKPVIFMNVEEPETTIVDDPQSDAVFNRHEIEMGLTTLYGLGYSMWQYAYRSELTLDETNFFSAMESMMKFTDENGHPLGVIPNLLVVSPNNYSEAQKIVAAGLIGGGNTNVAEGSVQLHVEPYLL